MNNLSPTEPEPNADSASVKKSAATKHLLPPIIPQQALGGRDTTCAGINMAPAVAAAGRANASANNPRDGLGLLGACAAAATATARLPHTYNISTSTELQMQVQMRQQMLLLQMQEQQRLRQCLVEQDLVLQMQEQQHLRQRLMEQDFVLQMQEQHAQEMLHQQQRLLIAEQRRREGMELLALQAGGGYGYGASGPFAACSPYTGASASAPAHLAMARTPAYTEAPFLAATRMPMPTLVSPVSPERAAAAAAAAAVPDQQQVAHAVGGREKKRKIHTDLPQGVNKKSSGGYEYEARIYRGKSRLIGLFDTVEQASAAYMSVRKDLDDAKLSSYGEEEVDALFDAAQKNAVEAVGGFVPKKKPKATPERDLPKGVQKLKSGKFQAKIYWEGKERHIGTFGTVEQADAAYISARKDLDDAKSSRLSADEMIARFDAAQKKAVEAVGGDMPRRQRPRENRVPTGVRETPSGEFEAIIRWVGKHWYVGIFDTVERASAAYRSVERDLVDVNPLPPDTTVARATFDAAKKKALETVQEMIESGEYGGMF